MSTVSVIMPAYNASQCVDRAMKSILNQTRPVDQVVIVDDGSNDDTAKIISYWSDRLPLILVRNIHNLGIGASLRIGVAASNGDLVFRLDADDYWLPDHIYRLESVATKDLEAVLFTSRALFVNHNRETHGVSPEVNDRNVRGKLMWDNPLIHSASGFRRTGYENVGGYREGVRWEDYDLWIRLLETGKLGVCNRPTVKYTLSDKSLSRVKRSVSLRSRWQCQKKAIGLFWFQHPIAAVRSSILGAGRVALLGFSKENR